MTEKDLMIQDLQEENRKLKEKIAELEKSKWIPCSERLPDKAIVICDILYEEEYTREKYHDIEILNYIGDCKFVNQWNDEKNVIAWQPLPEPYKEE